MIFLCIFCFKFNILYLSDHFGREQNRQTIESSEYTQSVALNLILHDEWRIAVRKKKTQVVVESKPAKVVKPVKKADKKTVVIDYPLEGEIINSHYYTFRIGTTPVDCVEVTTNGKEWHHCRPAAGYWWYDWSGYNSGPYIIQARIPGAGKRPIKSGLRKFTVLV